MNIGIYKNCYTEESFLQVEPKVINYDYRKNPEPELWEYALLFKFHREGIYRQHDLCGIFSPKFQNKALRTLATFHDWVAANPGYDLYVINPFPLIDHVFYNLWEQAEYWHPGLKEYSQKLFDLCGINISVENFPRGNHTTTSYCNYWVGSHRFWESYIPFLERMFEMTKKIEKKESFTKYHGRPVPFWVFSFELMVTTFIREIQPDFKVIAYPYPETEFEKLAQTPEEWGWHRFMQSGVGFLDSFYKDDAAKREEAKKSFQKSRQLASRLIKPMKISVKPRY